MKMAGIKAALMVLGCLAAHGPARAAEADRLRAMDDGGPAAQAEAFTNGRTAVPSAVEAMGSGLAGRGASLSSFKPRDLKDFAQGQEPPKPSAGASFSMAPADKVIFGGLAAVDGLAMALFGPVPVMALGAALLAGGLYLLISGAAAVHRERAQYLNGRSKP